MISGKKSKVPLILLSAAAIICLLSVITVTAESGGEYFAEPEYDVTLCDVNGDGKTSEADCNEIKNGLLYTDKDVTADLNGDGVTDIKDYILYKQQLAYENAEAMKKEAESYGIEYERSDGRVLTWHEEFDYDTFDSEKWSLYSSRGETGHDAEHLYIEDGKLTMVSTYSEDGGFLVPDYICTMTSMNYRYGYAELVARVPYQHGAFPAWWAVSNSVYAKADHTAEVDYWEVFGRVNEMGSTLHRWVLEDNYDSVRSRYPNVSYDHYKWGMHTASQKISARTGIEGYAFSGYVFEDYENLKNEYHTYAWEWDEHYMKAYIDGCNYFTFDISDEADWVCDNNYAGDMLYGMDPFDDYLYMILDNEYMYGSSFGYDGDGSAAVPEDCPFIFQIESIRLWQYPDTESVHLAEDIAAQTVWGDR